MRYRDWRLRLQDILEAISRIERYTAHMDAHSFQTDEKTLDAVVRNLEVIGEAARHIPEHVERDNPQIPWDKMRAIRNVLIHEYFGVSVAIIWHTVRHDLPPLAPLLQEILDRPQ